MPTSEGLLAALFHLCLTFVNQRVLPWMKRKKLGRLQLVSQLQC
jgi:hypothetical protein